MPLDVESNDALGNQSPVAGRRDREERHTAADDALVAHFERQWRRKRNVDGGRASLGRYRDRLEGELVEVAALFDFTKEISSFAAKRS